jgi:hypothetical protein
MQIDGYLKLARIHSVQASSPPGKDAFSSTTSYTLSLLESSFSSEKYRLFIKPLSIIPNFSDCQFRILSSMLQDLSVKSQLINTKRYFIHWTVETKLFIHLTQSHILQDQKSNFQDQMLKNI